MRHQIQTLRKKLTPSPTHQPSIPCFCSKDPSYYKCAKGDWEEILEIPGCSDISIKGNDCDQSIKSHRVFLAGLGKKIVPMLQDTKILSLPHPIEIVKILHEFALDGIVNCNEANITGVLKAAKMYNITGIKLLTGLYILSNLTVLNALPWHELSQKYLCHHIRQKIELFMMENFKEMSLQEGFLKNCSPQLMTALAKNDLLDSTEEWLFQTLISWAGKKQSNMEALKGILKLVRYQHMSLQYFHETVRNCELIKEDAPTMAKLDKIMQIFVGDPERNIRGNFRVSKEIVVAIGGFSHGPTTAIEVYDHYAQQWITNSITGGINFESHSYHGVVLLDKKLFVIGGFGGRRNEFYKDVFCLDLTTQTWSKKSPMLQPRCYVSVASLNGKIYCMGGFDGGSRLQSAEVYDPSTDRWSKLPDMQEIRSDGAAAVHGNKVWMTGGFNGTVPLQSTEYFDSLLGIWVSGPNMHTPRSGHCAISHKNSIVVLGGYDGLLRLNSTEVLDPDEPMSTRNWTEGKPMLTRRSNFATVTIKNELLALGGYTGTGVTKLMEIMDDAGWKQGPPLIEARSALAAICISGLPNRREYLLH